MPQRWIIAYDVADPKRLRRVAKHLEGVGTRLQFSVFECSSQAWQENRLRKTLLGHIEPTQDVLSYYPQCNACRGKSTSQGKGETPDAMRCTSIAQQVRTERLNPPAYWLV